MLYTLQFQYPVIGFKIAPSLGLSPRVLDFDPKDFLSEILERPLHVFVREDGRAEAV